MKAIKLTLTTVPGTELWSAIIISLIILLSAVMTTTYETGLPVQQIEAVKSSSFLRGQKAEQIPFNIFNISE